MKQILLVTALFSAAAFAKTPDTKPSFAETCRRMLLFSPLVAADHPEVAEEIKDDEGKIVAQVRGMLSADGMSLLKPSFTHYRGHTGDTELLMRLLAANPQLQEVELSLNDADLIVFNQTRGMNRTRIRATSIYQEFAAHGFTHIFMESVSPGDVQVSLSKKGGLWRVLRY